MARFTLALAAAVLLFCNVAGALGRDLLQADLCASAKFRHMGAFKLTPGVSATSVVAYVKKTVDAELKKIGAKACVVVGNDMKIAMALGYTTPNWDVGFTIDFATQADMEKFIYSLLKNNPTYKAYGAANYAEAVRTQISLAPACKKVGPFRHAATWKIKVPSKAKTTIVELRALVLQILARAGVKDYCLVTGLDLGIGKKYGMTNEDLGFSLEFNTQKEMESYVKTALGSGQDAKTAKFLADNVAAATRIQYKP